MASFVVDSRTLLAVRETLGRLQNQLLAMPTVVSGYDGMLGGVELESELEQFCTSWHYGILEVGEQIRELMDALLHAAAAYQQIEDGIRVAGQRGGASLSGSGVTVIGGGGGQSSSGGGSVSGSGTTVVAPTSQGGSVITTQVNGGKRGSGSGTIVIDADEERLAPCGV
jgi:hypothetical protein